MDGKQHFLTDNNETQDELQGIVFMARSLSGKCAQFNIYKFALRAPSPAAITLHVDHSVSTVPNAKQYLYINQCMKYVYPLKHCIAF